MPRRILALLIILSLGLPLHLAAQQPDEPVYDHPVAVRITVDMTFTVR
jgi:hypothetical protein